MAPLQDELTLGAQHLGNRIRERREAAHISRAELAHRCAGSPSSILAIEAGHRLPNLSTLHRISRALETSVTEILAGLYPFDVTISPAPETSNPRSNASSDHEDRLETSDPRQDGLTAARHLSSNLRQLRRARKLSQADLARTAGLARGHIARIEGRRSGSDPVAPRATTLAAISRALGVSSDELLTAPKPMAVYYYLTPAEAVTEQQYALILDRMLALSELDLGRDAGAHVSGLHEAGYTDDLNLIVGVAILASGPLAAEIRTRSELDRALLIAGVSATIDDLEITRDVADLQGATSV